VEKSQSELCLEIYRRFAAAGILNEVILIGSWCLPLYQEQLKPATSLPAIKTRDIDFLVPNPRKIKIKTDVAKLVENLDFVMQYKGDLGYMSLQHPALIIEFLVPQKGRGIDRPYPLPQFGINAQRLHMLDFLAKNTIKVGIEDFSITIPHPVNYALHKLLVAPKRTKIDKRNKDRIAGLQLLKVLIEKGERNKIRQVFRTIPNTWQKKIILELTAAEEPAVLDAIVNPNSGV
jgi:hypothetical protein